MRREKMRPYRIRIGIAGTPAAAFRSAVPDIQEELEQREYLRHPRVSWDDEGQRILMELEDDLEKGTVEQAERYLNDDISDVVWACVSDWDEWEYQIVDVSPA